MVPESAEISGTLLHLSSPLRMNWMRKLLKEKKRNRTKMTGNKTKIVVGSFIAVFILPAILGFLCNQICSGWAMEGLTNLHFSALFEIMLICVIVVICGIGAVLIIAKKPLSALKVNPKTSYPISRKY
jgi:hypothetical protein